MIDHASIKVQAAQSLEMLDRRLIIAKHERQQLSQEISSLKTSQEQIRQESDLLKLAITVTQQLIDTVSAANIKRVEDLVNSALKTIFHDLDLTFRIISEVKRNQVQNRIAIYQNGIEGGINSFGGGVLAVVALVLKVLFNLFAKRYPLIVLDESLAFLSDRYIPNASRFLKDLSLEFGMPFLLVTHQPAFAEAADLTYEISSASSKTATFTLKRDN